MPTAPTPRRPLAALALALACACKPTPAADARPERPLPTDVAALPLFDPAAIGPGAAPPAGPAEPLRVLDVGPRGPVDPLHEIHVRFNQPVVALDLAADATGLLHIDPPLAGDARWAEPDRLVFRPAGDPRPATRYRVRLAALRGPDGAALVDPPTWTFETPRPTLYDASAADAVDHSVREPVLVRFDQPIAPAELAGYLTASARPLAADGPAAPVPIVVRAATRADLERAGWSWYAADPAHNLLVRPQATWPAASRIALDLRPGLQGSLGPLPLDVAWRAEFTTPQPQALLAHTCTRAAPCGFEAPVLRFRNPIPEAELKKISVTPRPAEFAVDAHDEREVVLSGGFLPDVRYTVRVGPDLKDSFGQTLPATTRTLAFVERAGLGLDASAGILASARPHVGLETHHLGRVRVRVGLYDDAELAAVADTDDPADHVLAALPFPARAREQLVDIAARGPTLWGSQVLDLAALTAALRPAGPLRGAVLVEVTPVDLLGDAARRERPPAVRGLYRVTDLMLLAHASRAATVVRAVRLPLGTPAPGVAVCRLGPAEDDTTCRPLGTTDQDGFLRADVPFPARLRPPPPAPDDLLVDEATDEDPDEDPAPEPAPERLRLVARDPSGDRTHLDLGLAPYTRVAANPQLRPGERLLLGLVRERGAYRPGERVHVVGWSAIETPYDRRTLATLAAGTRVTFSLRGPDGVVVARASARTSKDGKYAATLRLPDDARLGGWSVDAALAGAVASADLRVEDYRVPEFAVTAAPRRPDILAGEPLVVDIRADYYFGGPVPMTATAQTTCTPLRYRPPNLDGAWSVGDGDLPYRTHGPRAPVPATPRDPPGQRTLDAAPALADPLDPHRCDVHVYATDASAQGVGADTGVTVHPAPIYLAVRPPPHAVHVGDRAQILLRAVDRDGDRRPAPRVRLELERHWDEPVYGDEDGLKFLIETKHRHVALPPCTVDLAAAGPDAACTLAADAPGEIRVVARATVDGRTARTTAAFHVTPRPKDTPVVRRDPPRGLELIPSAVTVRPGDRVDILVRAPWNGARGQLVAARAGVHAVHPFTLENEQATISLVADDTWTPALHLEAHVLAPDRLGLLRRHSRTATLTQAPDHRRLVVAVTAPREAGPGDRLPIAVAVTDPAGRPVAGRVALWAVDEAVLALTDERTPDLLPRFVPDRRAEVDDYDDFYDLLLPYVPTATDPWLSGGGGGRGFGSRSTRVPQVRQARAEVQGSPTPRQRFETTPLFLADVALDAAGTARVTATLPDNLTTFRITAIASAPLASSLTPSSATPSSSALAAPPASSSVAARSPASSVATRVASPSPAASASTTLVASPTSTSASPRPAALPPAPGRFGGGEARTVVTAPLVVRAAAPRQLRPGDTAELAAIVENRTGAAGRVAVTAALVDATGPHGPALELLSEGTAHAEIPAAGQARLAFRVRARAPVAARLDLRARLTAAGRAPAEDAVRVPLPVAAEATLIDRVAVHGALTTDRAAALPVRLPQGVLAGHGGLELRASTSLVAGLEDAARALIDYPYGCAEQTASRLLPLVALRALALPVPDGFAAAAFTRLAAMQTPGGGFAYWPGDRDVHPYASAYATWMLQRAASAGLPVPKDMLSRALDDLEARAADTDLAALSASLRADAGVPQALALHALADAGRDIDAAAAALFTHRAALPLFARATLLLAVRRRDPADPRVPALADELLAAVSEGPSEAHTVERAGPGLDAYFHSDTRSDALVLLALLHARPDHPVLAKLVRGLEDRRHGGAWRNTQENAYAILALATWAALKESETPDLAARVWLAGRSALDAPLHGREATTTFKAPLADLLALTEGTGGLLPVVLQREGTGPLYWRLGVDWAPAGDPPARDQGLAVTRSLRAAAGAPTTTAELGAAIAVDLELRSHRRARYVALDIPIPAGLEPLQQHLGRGQSAASLGGASGRWIDREELHHDRVLVFADDLPPGTHRHTIHLRATSRGTYAFPPARAEAMYAPEIYGRTAATTLTVR